MPTFAPTLFHRDFLRKQQAASCGHAATTDANCAATKVS
jgi:hypothetical protein